MIVMETVWHYVSRLCLPGGSNLIQSFAGQLLTLLSCPSSLATMCRLSNLTEGGGVGRIAPTINIPNYHVPTTLQKVALNVCPKMKNVSVSYHYTLQRAKGTLWPEIEVERKER